MDHKPMLESNFSTTDLQKQKIQEQRELVAVKKNSLIQSYKLEKGYNYKPLTLLEQKVMLYLISKIKPEDTAFSYMNFSVKEFYAVCGIEADKSGKNYANLKNVVVSLSQKVMWLKDDDTKRETMVRWIDRAMIDGKDGSISVKLDDLLRPYLLELRANYVQIPLFDVIRMKSKHGIALYELLRSYAYTNMRVRFTIDDLKNKLDCSSYDHTGHFRSKVIDPAVADINNYSELAVSYELIKEGRAYKDIIFSIQDLRKSKRDEDRQEADRRRANVEREIDPRQLSLFDIED